MTVDLVSVLGATQATAELFREIAVILAVSALAALAATWLRQPDVVVFGSGRFGHRVLEAPAGRGVDALAVDLDPVAVRRWHEWGARILCGDAEEPSSPPTSRPPESGWVVSTIRHTDTNLALLHPLCRRGYEGSVVVAAHHDADAALLEEVGATRVLLPYASAAAEIVELVAPRA